MRATLVPGSAVAALVALVHQIRHQVVVPAWPVQLSELVLDLEPILQFDWRSARQRVGTWQEGCKFLRVVEYHVHPHQKRGISR
jgi:hypothetical protein